MGGFFELVPNVIDAPYGPVFSIASREMVSERPHFVIYGDGEFLVHSLYKRQEGLDHFPVLLEKDGRLSYIQGLGWVAQRSPLSISSSEIRRPANG